MLNRKINLVIAVMLYLQCAPSSASSTNTKQYCVPTDLTQYNPSLVEISEDNLEKFSDAVETGIIRGNTADTETTKINNSPNSIFALTAEAVTSFARGKTKPSPIMNTKSMIGEAIEAEKIIYDRRDIVQVILDGLLGNIVGLVPSNGGLIFSGSTPASSSANNSNASQQSINQQNSSKLVGQLSYNDAYKNSLCSVDPTLSTSNNGSLDITQIYINSTALENEIKGCEATMPQGSSSDDSSSSPGSDQVQAPNSGSSKNYMTSSLKQCSAAIGACEINYLKNTIYNQVTTYLNGQISSKPEFASEYNEIIVKLNDIFNEEIPSSMTTAAGNVFGSNCLLATCSGSSCATADDVKNTMAIFSNQLKSLNEKLRPLVTQKINTIIDQCEQTKNKNYIDQDYYMNNGLTLGQIFAMNSYGVPNTDSYMKCSNKTKYQTETISAIAEEFINKISDSVKAPSIFSPSVSLNDSVVLQGGSFGYVDNQNNFSPYSPTIQNIKNARSTSNSNLLAYTKEYNNIIKSFVSQKSLALQNLRYLLLKKSTITEVPTVSSNSQYDNRCSEGLNNPNGSNCSFSTPYENIKNDFNLTTGQICSTAELEDIQATWRINPGPNNTINPFQQKIKYSSGTDVAKAKVLLLAEIREQKYINKQLKDKIITTKSSQLLIDLSQNKKTLLNLIKNMKNAVAKYIKGG